MKNRAFMALLALLAGLTAACSPNAEADGRGYYSIQRDSSGITIVESTLPIWPQGEAWLIDSEPETVIGAVPPLKSSMDASEDQPDPVALSLVQAVRVLSTGSIVIADAGSAQVMVFDRAGTLESRFGGKGGGPGEFPRIVDVHSCAGDSIVVADGFDVHVFDDRGAFARRASYRPRGQMSSLVAISANCRQMLIRQEADAPLLGKWGAVESVFTWVDPVTETADTVTHEVLAEVWTRRLYGDYGSFAVPWGTAYTAAVDRDALVVGYGRTPELRRYDADGRLVSLVRWNAQPSPIRRGDRRRYSKLRMEWLAGMPDHPETRFWFPELDEYPGLPTQKPIYDRVLMDDQHRAWVSAFPEESFGPFDARLNEPTWSNRTWLVFDSVGVWLGELTLPKQFDLKAVARGRLYGVAKDSLDVETVRVFTFRGGGSLSP